ncbi:hypothetical protein KI387_021440, partial [Taxus chinensis]
GPLAAPQVWKGHGFAFFGHCSASPPRGRASAHQGLWHELLFPQLGAFEASRSWPGVAAPPGGYLLLSRSILHLVRMAPECGRWLPRGVARAWA